MVVMIRHKISVVKLVTVHGMKYDMDIFHDTWHDMKAFCDIPTVTTLFFISAIHTVPLYYCSTIKSNTPFSLDSPTQK